MLRLMLLFTLLYIRSFPQFLDGTAIATYIADSRASRADRATMPGLNNHADLPKQLPQMKRQPHSPRPEPTPAPANLIDLRLNG